MVLIHHRQALKERCLLSAGSVTEASNPFS